MDHIPKTLRQRIAPAWREWWDERVTIMEVDGYLSTEKAQEKATICLLEWAKTHTPLDYAKEGKVYILHEEGTTLYKIGRSWSPMNRRDQLQAGAALPLRLLREIYHYDCVAFERMLHARYKRYRKHGEWFALPPETLATFLNEEFPCNRGKGVQPL